MTHLLGCDISLIVGTKKFSELYAQYFWKYLPRGVLQRAWKRSYESLVNFWPILPIPTSTYQNKNKKKIQLAGVSPLLTTWQHTPESACLNNIISRNRISKLKIYSDNLLFRHKHFKLFINTLSFQKFTLTPIDLTKTT